MPIVNGVDLRSGINGTALLNGTEQLPIISWSFPDTTKVVDFENSKSGGTTIEAGTFLNVDFTIVFDADFANNPLKAPSGLIAGAILTNIKLLADRTSTLGYFIYNALVKSVPVSVNVSGKIGMSVRCHANAYALAS
jgi:hypothetical protein